MESLGHKGFRGKQLSTHYFERLVDTPDQMTDLPKGVRDDLVRDLLPTLLTPMVQRTADDGQTVKYAWRLHDGAIVESVLMRYPNRVTMCISSQAGCGMNCPFCATGQAGLTRNLSTAEIVEQVVYAARSLRRGGLAGGGGEEERTTPLRVSNVVFMGMGEALANYTAAIGAIRRLVDPAPDGLGMSARGITMSTVGLVPAVDKLGGRGHTRHAGALAARAGRRAAQRAGARSTRGGPWTRRSTRHTGTSRPRSGASRSSTP